MDSHATNRFRPVRLAAETGRRRPRGNNRRHQFSLAPRLGPALGLPPQASRPSPRRAQHLPTSSSVVSGFADERRIQRRSNSRLYCEEEYDTNSRRRGSGGCPHCRLRSFDCNPCCYPCLGSSASKGIGWALLGSPWRLVEWPIGARNYRLLTPEIDIIAGGFTMIVGTSLDRCHRFAQAGDRGRSAGRIIGRFVNIRTLA